jgi:hypothetical protein
MRSGRTGVECISKPFDIGRKIMRDQLTAGIVVVMPIVLFAIMGTTAVGVD